MYRKLILFVVFLFSVVLGGYYDSKMQSFTQPNGVTFQARIYGDGAEAHFRTSDGYEILKGVGEYYYYAILDSSENIFTQSEFKVEIDCPPSCSYKLEYIENISCTKSTSRSSVNGNYKIGIVLVEFSDKKHYVDSSGNGYAKADFENMMFSYDGSWNTDETGATNPEGREVFGSLKEYYEFQSNGHVTIDTASCVILTPNGDLWHELSDSFYNYSLNGIIVELNLGGPFYSDYDKICIIHAGNTEYGTLLSPRAYCPGRYWIAGERHQYWYGIQAFTHIGIHAHEFGHTLGLNHTGGRYWNTNLMDSTAKYWDVMLCGNVNGPLKDAACPAGINPVYKLWYGWIDESDTVHISHNVSNLSVEYNYNSPKYYIVNRNHGINGGEYFILENRQREGWDKYTPIKPDYIAQPDDVNGNEGGLLILRVQELNDELIWATNIPANNVFPDPYSELDYSLYQSAYCRNPFPLFQGQSIDDYSTPNTNYYNISGSSITSARNSGYAFHNILWDNNTKTITLDIYTNTSGYITSDTVWAGNILILDNITINSGVTLTGTQGTTVKFASGKSLYINSGGSLIANGATFTKRYSSKWGGVRFQSGSGGNLSNCTITQASYGIKCENSTPVIDNCDISNSTYGMHLSSNANPAVNQCTIEDCSYGLYLSGASPVIDSCTVSDCSTYGLYVYNSSPELNTNRISNSRVYLNNCGYFSVFTDNLITGQTWSGMNAVFMYNSSPRFYYNTIDVEDALGIEVSGGNPVFGGSAACGYNILDNDPSCDGVLWATNNASVVLGYGPPDMGPYEAAYNAIYGGYTPLAALGSSSIYATHCYWGQYPAPACYGNVNTWAELLTDPGGGSSLSKSAVPNLITGDNTKNTTADSLFYAAYALISKEELASALVILNEIIHRFQDSPYAYKALHTSLRLCADHKAADGIELLDDLHRSVDDPDLKTFALSQKALQLREKGNMPAAIALSETILNDSRESSYALTSLFDLFNMYHKDLGNNEMAMFYLNELKARYPESALTLIARSDMGENVSNIKLAKRVLPEEPLIEQETILPEAFALHHAYPNPFNPSTRIRVELPESGELILDILDIRGRVVDHMLMNKQAGTHEIPYAPKQLSTGIYFIRARFKDQIQMQKIMYLK